MCWIFNTIITQFQHVSTHSAVNYVSFIRWSFFLAHRRDQIWQSSLTLKWMQIWKKSIFILFSIKNFVDYCPFLWDSFLWISSFSNGWISIFISKRKNWSQKTIEIPKKKLFCCKYHTFKVVYEYFESYKFPDVFRFPNNLFGTEQQWFFR